MISSISYGDEVIAYKLVRNPLLTRKLRIHVHPNGSVEVEAPETTPQCEIAPALRKRLRWVHQRLSEQKDVRTHTLPREYVSGETHFYLGRRCLLKVSASPGPRGEVKLIGGKLEVRTKSETPGEVKDTLGRWYRRRAKVYFDRKLEELSETLPWIQQTPALVLRSMKT